VRLAMIPTPQTRNVIFHSTFPMKTYCTPDTIDIEMLLKVEVADITLGCILNANIIFTNTMPPAIPILALTAPLRTLNMIAVLTALWSYSDLTLFLSITVISWFTILTEI